MIFDGILTLRDVKCLGYKDACKLYKKAVIISLEKKKIQDSYAKR